MRPPMPENERARIEALQKYQILDTCAEKVFDEITAMAADVCQTPMSLLTFVDEDRQWFKSKVGVSVEETSREVAFCAHAIMGRDLFVVPDALADQRFAENPLVTGEPNIRFYAGMPLVNREGHALGTLCVIDTVPRELTKEQADRMRALARGAVMLLEARRPPAPDQ